MVSIGHRIKEIAKKKNISVSVIAEKLRMTEQNVYKILKKNSIKCDVLIRISEILNEPLNVLFGEVNNLDSSEGIQFYKDLLIKRERDIEFLQDQLKSMQEKFEQSKDKTVKPNAG